MQRRRAGTRTASREGRVRTLPRNSAAAFCALLGSTRRARIGGRPIMVPADQAGGPVAPHGRRSGAASAVWEAAARLRPFGASALPPEMLSSAFGAVICAMFVLSPNVSKGPADVCSMCRVCSPHAAGPAAAATPLPCRLSVHCAWHPSPSTDISHTAAHCAGHDLHHCRLPLSFGAGTRVLQPPSHQGCVPGKVACCRSLPADAVSRQPVLCSPYSKIPRLLGEPQAAPLCLF